MKEKVNQKENKTDVIVLDKLTKQVLNDVEKEISLIQRDLQHVSAKKQAIISIIISQAGYSVEDTFNFDADGNLILVPKK